jgi:universal stress protein E
MIWRHLMWALSSAAVVPAPMLDRAGRLARGLGAELEMFLTLYEPDIVQTPDRRALLEERIAARIDEERRRLERLADQLRSQGVKVRASVRWDYPMYEGVIRQVLRHRPDLLIVSGIDGGEVLPRTLAYREARLIELCPCPVLLLKEREVYSKGSVVAAVDPRHADERSPELDEAIIGAARTVSHALADAPVHLYHSIAPAPRFGDGEVPGTAPPAIREAARLAGAQMRLWQVALQHDIREDQARVEFGLVETALPAFARERRAQVVVMGAMSQLVDALDCDVLVVKPERFRTPVSAEHSPAVPLPF